MTIFLVKSNLKLDGDNFLAGSFIEGDAGRFNTLISGNVLEEVTGAETMEEAKEIVAKRDAEVAAEEEIAEERKPQNTWGPTKKEDETPADETPTEATPETPVETEKKEEVTTETKVINTPAESVNKPAETTPAEDESGANL